MDQSKFVASSKILEKSVLEQDIDIVIQIMSMIFSDESAGVSNFSDIVSRVVSGASVDLADLARGPLDGLFVRHLREPLAGSINAGCGSPIIGPEYDCCHSSVNYSLLSVLNRLRNWRVPTKESVAVVVACRSEGAWLLEWLAYHRAMGVTDFYVGYNDNSDGSDELIQCLEAHGIIRSFRLEMSGDRSPQLKFYNYCVNFLDRVHTHDWVFFIDVDEFYVPLVGAGCLDSFNQLNNINVVDCLYFPWVWCSGNNKYEWDPGLVTERFEYMTPGAVVKCVARPRSIWSAHHPHTVQTIRENSSVNASGLSSKLDPNTGALDTTANTSPIGRIYHYFGKSFEEFALKRHRGSSDGKESRPRDFASFNWGQRSGYREPFPYLLKERLDQELVLLKTLTDVQRLSLECDSKARGLLGKLKQNIDLKKEFEIVKAVT